MKNKCNKCNSELQEVKLNNFMTLYKCSTKCNNYITEYCQHKNYIQVKKGKQVVNQCKDCGVILKNSFSKGIVDIKSIESYDILYKKYDVPEYIKDFEKAIADYKKEQKYELELTKESNKTQRSKFFKAYNLYLNSKEWKAKRKQVLKRDNNNCQCCMKSKASQVHHLTYDRVGHEFLTDLVSICDKCHNIAHNKINIYKPFKNFIDWCNNKYIKR